MNNSSWGVLALSIVAILIGIIAIYETLLAMHYKDLYNAASRSLEAEGENFVGLPAARDEARAQLAKIKRENATLREALANDRMAPVVIAEKPAPKRTAKKAPSNVEE